MDKEIFGIIAIIISIYAFAPYIRSILQGKTKPHVFSWIIWGIATIIVFFAQLADDGGAGAWAIGVSAIFTLFVAFLAYRKKADITITRLDWAFFILALLSLPLWFLTSDPLWAVVILSLADTLGFLPTIRKSYEKPHEERLDMYICVILRNFVSIAALEHYSLTTILFPAVVTAQCVPFVIMVLWRRKQLHLPK